jgi:hypothetical protein
VSNPVRETLSGLNAWHTDVVLKFFGGEGGVLEKSLTPVEFWPSPSRTPYPPRSPYAERVFGALGARWVMGDCLFHV